MVSLIDKYKELLQPVGKKLSQAVVQNAPKAVKFAGNVAKGVSDQVGLTDYINTQKQGYQQIGKVFAPNQTFQQRQKQAADIAPLLPKLTQKSRNVAVKGSLFAAPGALPAAVVGGTIGGLGAKLQGQNVGQGVGQGITMGVQSNAVSGLTNPFLSKLIPKNTSILTSRVLPAGLNTLQGVGVDRFTGQQTTPVSLGVDFGVGLLGGKSQFDAPVKLPKTNIEPSQLKGLIPVAPTADKPFGGMVRPARSRLIKVDGIQGRNPDGTYSFKAKVPQYVGDKVKDVTVQFRTDPTNPNRLLRMGGGLDNAYGLAMGFEPEYDENGKVIGVRVDPNKAVLGMGLIAGKNALGGKVNFTSLLDKKPRFEIDDSGAKLLKGWSNGITNMFDPGIPMEKVGKPLSQVLEHPTLYKQYPELANTKVVAWQLPEGTNAQFNPIKNEITINEKVLTSRDKLENLPSTLLHEIQHAIQEIEGFARGGNPESVAKNKEVLKNTGQALTLRRDMDAVLKDNPNLSADEIFGEIARRYDYTLGEGAGDFVRNLPDSQKARVLATLPETFQKRYDELKRMFGGSDVLGRVDESGFSGYKRLSGELEARAVQRRMNMPADQRSSIDPYNAEMVATGTNNPKDYITRFDSEIQAFQPTKGVEAEVSDIRSPRQKGEALQTPTKSQELPKETSQVLPGVDSGSANRISQPDSMVGKTVQGQLSPVQSSSQPYFNTKNLNVSPEIRSKIDSAVSEVKPQIEKFVGKTLTNKEAIEKANLTTKVLNTAVNREQTLAWEAALLKTRQKLAALSQNETVDKEYLDTIVTLKSLGTDIARKLQSFGIGADPSLATSKQAILEAVLKVEKDTDKVLKAAQGVDFDNLSEATNFYRTFVKPHRGEMLDLLRYNSMLSSPNTHINNVFSNFQGTGIIAPIEKTISGGIDAIASAFTKQDRKMFAGEGAAYAKGYYSNIKKATENFANVLKGTKLMESPDLRNIPMFKDGTRLAKYEKALNLPMRLLEASDQFFTALTEGGETAALNYRMQKGQLTGLDVEKMARDAAAKRLFRSKLGENEGSKVLDAVDIVANKVQSLKGSDNILVRNFAKFTLPFLKTPTNILKQGIEYSPLGLSTLPGAKDKTEQVAKAVIGSAIGVGTAMLAAKDGLTWAEPTGEKEKQAFRAAGLQPYSVKIGNNWFSYSKLHPAVSFNLAMVAALKDAQDKQTLTDGEIETVATGLAKWLNFYADQSYLKNIGDMVSATKGDLEGMTKLISNYPQQVIPFRALMSWVARLTDPYQRKVDPDGGILEKQLQQLATQIPLLSQTVPARLDQLGNPIENQNRVLNAFSPVKTTTEVPDQKEMYNFLKEKSQLNREKSSLNKQLEKEAKQNVYAPQASASDSEYIAGTGLRKLNSFEKDKVDTYLEFGRAVSKQDLENRFLGDISDLPTGNKYEKAIRDSKLYSKLSTVNDSEKLSEQQKSTIKDRIAQEVGVSRSDLDYYEVANDSDNLKTIYVMESIAGKSNPTDYLANGRKKVNGELLVSDGVIDNLVDEGIITKVQGKALKNIDYTDEGKLKVKSGTGKKIKVTTPEAPKIPVIKLSQPKRARLVRPATKQYKINKIRLKSKGIKKVKKLTLR